jgi:16S rRNA G1207 methylase RsmC
VTKVKKKVNSKGRVTERKYRGVVMPTASHKTIRAVKRAGHEPSIHGTKLWRSSFLIMDYLHKNPPEKAGTVLDAGCGWGITGIWFAKRFGSQVISMDADPDVSRTRSVQHSTKWPKKRCAAMAAK